MHVTFRVLLETLKASEPNRLIIFDESLNEQTPTCEGVGQSNADIDGFFGGVFCKKERSCKQPKIKKTKVKHPKIKLPQPKQHMFFFLPNKRRAFLSGVLIQLKINTGNEAVSLFKRAASLPLSLYVAGRRQC